MKKGEIIDSLATIIIEKGDYDYFKALRERFVKYLPYSKGDLKLDSKGVFVRIKPSRKYKKAMNLRKDFLLSIYQEVCS